MAFSSFIRRVSAEIGSVVGGRRVISPLTNVQKGLSTTPDQLADKLFGLVESGKCTQQSPNTMNFPDEFPFGIEENDQVMLGEFSKYLLRRKYQDEMIVVGLEGYEVLHGTQIPLVAHVLRGSQHLRFEMMAKPNRIDIKTCTIKDTGTGHVNAFSNYLDIRGFNSSTINSLIDFQKSSHVPVIGFPFEIVDKRGKEGVLFFTREFEDETINTEVSGLPACVSNIENPEREFQMSVTVFRTLTRSNFKIRVFPHRPDPILLHEVFTRTEYVHLDAFQEFWEIRGIKPSITNFLFDYFNTKAQQNYGSWTGVKFS